MGNEGIYNGESAAIAMTRLGERYSCCVGANLERLESNLKVEKRAFKESDYGVLRIFSNVSAFMIPTLMNAAERLERGEINVSELSGIVS